MCMCVSLWSFIVNMRVCVCVCVYVFDVFSYFLCIDVCVCLRVYMYAYMIAHGSWHKDTLPAHHTSHGWKQSNSKACKVCRMMQDGTQCTIRVLCPFAVPNFLLQVKRGIVAGSGFSAWTLLSGYEREASQEPRSAGDAARTPHLRTARRGGFRCVLDCA